MLKLSYEDATSTKDGIACLCSAATATSPWSELETGDELKVELLSEARLRAPSRRPPRPPPNCVRHLGYLARSARGFSSHRRHWPSLLRRCYLLHGGVEGRHPPHYHFHLHACRQPRRRHPSAGGFGHRGCRRAASSCGGVPPGPPAGLCIKPALRPHHKLDEGRSSGRAWDPLFAALAMSCGPSRTTPVAPTGAPVPERICVVLMLEAARLSRRPPCLDRS